MAKLTMEFDTQTKLMSVSIDGTPVADVDSITFYKTYDGYTRGDNDEERYDVNIVTEVKKDELTGMRVRTYLYAAESQAAEKATEKCQLSNSVHAGFVQASENVSVLNDIAAFISGK